MKIPPPIRTTVPLLLLLFGLVLASANYVVLLYSGKKRAQQSVVELARSQASRLSGLATAAIRSEQLQRLTNDLGYLDEDPELKFAFICDKDFRILNSSATEWVGRPLDSTPASFVRDSLDTVVKTGRPLMRVVGDREVAIAAQPRRSKGEIAKIAIVVRDMSNPLGEARRTALLDALSTGGVLFLTLGLLWVGFHLFITLRLERLLRVAREVTPADPALAGEDETAEVSAALMHLRGRSERQSQALALKEERYRRLVETLPALVIINRNERVEFVNRRGLDMLRAESEEQVLGRVIYEFIHPDYLGTTRRHMEQILVRGGQLTALEQRLLRLDGSTVHVELAASPFRDEKGDAVQMVATDVSERIESAAKREALSRDLQEKNKELEAVLYVASHDLRSPLVNVMGFSRQLSTACDQLGGMLQRAREGSSVADEMEPLVTTTIPRALKFIEQGVAKMDALLAGFLRFSRLGSAAMEIKHVDMGAMLRSILSTMTYQTQQAGADVRLGELPACGGDPTQINQVFTNLIDNAVKYRHPQRPCVISVEGRAVEGAVIYTVTDNGIGVAAAHVEKIFEIFHRLNPTLTAGEGLGLTIAQRIVKRHNGNITVESELGEGTSFTITLPPSPATPA